MIFLFCPFVTIMTMFIQYLRHKVDLIGCFTFKLQVNQFIAQMKAYHTNSLQIVIDFENSILVAFSIQKPDTNTLV